LLAALDAAERVHAPEEREAIRSHVYPEQLELGSSGWRQRHHALSLAVERSQHDLLG
jgi:hypothetical protein